VGQVGVGVGGGGGGGRHVVGGRVGGCEGNFGGNALHPRLQWAGADFLNARVDRGRHVGDGIDRVRSEFERHPLGREEGDVLLDQRYFGFRQNPSKVVARERQ